ncbi:MAG TPA: HEPN domain-containing protein [Thermosynergistes sp.]|nr:HEPN domain-containing protein [Thermosynergistes sp.]
MKAEERAEVARWWMEKADRSLDAACLLYKRGDFDFCVNRLYYAAFYAVSAVLVARGQNYSKHSAVRAALHRDFVKTGMVDIRFAKLYDHLFYSRQKADYEAFTELDPEVLEEDMRQVTEFLAALRALLQKRFPIEERKNGPSEVKREG